MKQLESFQDKLVREMKEITKEINHLWSAVDHHWNLLDTDMIEREMFKKKYTDISYDVLNGLRTELKRCEELKKANIKV